MKLYCKGDIVLLTANPYHVGIVRADQVSSHDDVLVEWLSGKTSMQPHEIILETAHRAFHPVEARRPLFDVFEPAPETYAAPKLWEVAG